MTRTFFQHEAKCDACHKTIRFEDEYMYNTLPEGWTTDYSFGEICDSCKKIGSKKLNELFGSDK